MKEQPETGLVPLINACSPRYAGSENTLFNALSELHCHGNFGPAKILVRGTKIPGKLVRPDHFSLKILVRPWNNGTSISALVTSDCWSVKP